MPRHIYYPHYPLRYWCVQFSSKIKPSTQLLKIWINMMPLYGAFPNLLPHQFCIYFSALSGVCSYFRQSRNVERTCYWRRTDWRTQMTSLTSLRRRSALVTAVSDLTTEWTERTSNARRPVNTSEFGVTENPPVTVKAYINWPVL